MRKGGAQPDSSLPKGSPSPTRRKDEIDDDQANFDKQNLNDQGDQLDDAFPDELRYRLSEMSKRDSILMRRFAKIKK